MILNTDNNLVFSYGTLKRGFPNHGIMNEINAKYISDAMTKFKYPLLLATKWHSPFMIHIKNYPNSYKVSGELFEVDKKGIQKLDKFEGVDKCYYKRLKIETCFNNEKGQIITKDAWCYFRYKDSTNLLDDFSKFIPFYGEKEMKKYTALHLRPLNWRNQ